MKIVVVGPGAIGTLLTALLSRAIKSLDKDEVWLLDYKKERANELLKKGITIEGANKSLSVNVKVTAQIEQIGPADIFIICVKSYNTKQVISAIKPVLKNGGSVLTLQNGLGNAEIISEAVGAEKVIMGVTNLGATLIKPEVVRFCGKGETLIGRFDGKMTAQMRSIRDIFNKAGIETKISKDIKSLIWSKLIINAGINPLTAILRVNNGRLIELEGARRIMHKAITEAVRVAKRKRIKLIFDDPLAKIEAVAEATAENLSSMLQDILHKKRTEIDFINGAIVRQGQELGIPVLTNQLLIDLIHSIEEGYSKSLA
ncbi:MAG: 2-dehydropantoate 2-reductase [Candidatus Omnitrophota bacterium]